jgi:tol-pal system protein YbgF
MNGVLRLTVILVLAALPARAQDPDPRTLGDIRTELTALYAQIQELRTLFSTSGAETGVVNSGPALQRLDALETELRRVTGDLERVEGHVQAVIEDGTRRVGDLEFRLTELEGGDISALGDTPVLGGETGGAGAGLIESPLEGTGTETVPGAEAPQLAVSEQADFDAAMAAYSGGDFAGAVQRFAAFQATYPGGPLSGEARFYEAESLAATGDWRRAARAYLEVYSGAPTGPRAPVALLRLGNALAELGQTETACQTLGELASRYPGAEAPVLAEAETRRAALGCL